MNQEMWMSIARKLALAVGTWLVAKGGLSEDQTAQFAEAIVVVLGVIWWGLTSWRKQSDIVEAALSLPAGATIEDAKAIVNGDNGEGPSISASGLILILALSLAATACGEKRAAPAMAQVYIGLNGVADGMRIAADEGEFSAIDHSTAKNHLARIAQTSEIMSQRLQAGGYRRNDMLDLATKLVIDVRAMRDTGVIRLESPRAQAVLNLTLFAVETGASTAKIVIAKRGDQVAAKREARAAILAAPRARGLKPATLEKLISLGQQVTVDLVTVNYLTEAEAWAKRAELAGALKTKLAQ